MVHELVGYTISGLVTAGIYAIVACGLTLTFTTTGIFNWAHGALVAVGAFSYWQLTVGWGLPIPLAVAVCLVVVGPLMGAAIEWAIMHRLEGTSEATRMVVSLALLLGLLAGINWIWEPGVQRLVPPLFDGRVVTVLDQRIPFNDITVITTAMVVAVLLRVLLYRTRAGIEMRATVDDRTLATLNGTSVPATARRSWAVGSTLAVLAGILIAPRGSLAATTLALLIVNAYAAAIIGRLRSLPMTFAGAVILGLANDYAHGYIGSRQDIPGQQYLVGLINVLPVIVLFAVLQLLPHDRLRGARSLRIKEVAAEPTWRGSLALAAGVVGASVAMAPIVAAGDLNTMTRIWGLALVALSLVPLVGYAGRLSVCPLSFAAVGAIVVAHLGHHGNPLGLVLAVVITAGVGALVSLPALRLSGLYQALATAAFAVMLDGWIFRLPPFDAVVRIPFTGIDLYRHRVDLFQGGNLSIDRLRLAGVDLSGDHAYFVGGSIAFGLAVLLVTAIRRSGFGRRLVALKDSPIGYATLGLDQRRTTVAVFALSAGIAGLGGALYGGAVQRPSPDLFTFFTGLNIVLTLVIFGVGSAGAALGAGIFVGGPTLPRLFPSLSQLSATMIGAAGIGLGRNPNGMAPTTVRPGWAAVARARPVLVAGVGLVAGAYLLRITGVMANWPFAVVVLGVALGLPAAARRVTDRPGAAGPTDPGADGLTAAPEMLGLLLPLTAGDLEVLDRHLAWPVPVGTGTHDGT